jgi:adenylosuccinate lyase
MTSILGNRYASPEMREIWSREFKIKAERRLWISALETQTSIGLKVPASVVEDYKKSVESVNLESIDHRESLTKHDVKARIDEFNSLAGHQEIHIGMTSRDVTENIELYQISTSMHLTRMKVAALSKCLAEFAQDNLEVKIVARTHNVPAQITTLGRKFATWIEELLFALDNLQNLHQRLPLKGVKGPVGTSQDLIDLLGTDSNKIEEEVAVEFGFNKILIAPSQIYPRSIDYEVVTALVQLASAPSNIATNIRIMSGLGLLSEGFEIDQVGSSAMPHKINPRLSERVNGLTAVLKGHATMVQELVGNQWNEGDISCSVVRRVALADSFYAIDAILDTTMKVVTDIDVHLDAIQNEVDQNLPFLLTTKLISTLVKNGRGREDAYSAVKSHVLKARESLKLKGINNFFELLQKDSSLGINSDIIDELQDFVSLIGHAKIQASKVISNAWSVSNACPESLSYKPRILI